MTSKLILQLTKWECLGKWWTRKAALEFHLKMGRNCKFCVWWLIWPFVLEGNYQEVCGVDIHFNPTMVAEEHSLPFVFFVPCWVQTWQRKICLQLLLSMNTVSLSLSSNWRDCILEVLSSLPPLRPSSGKYREQAGLGTIWTYGVSRCSLVIRCFLPLC